MKQSQNNLHTKFPSVAITKLTPRSISQTSSLFLTAKSSFKSPYTPSKQPLQQTSKNSFKKSHYLDDKVLTDRLILDINPSKASTRNSSQIHEKNSINSKKIKGFILKNETTRNLSENANFTINDSISENYLRNLNEKTEEIHCEE